MMGVAITFAFTIAIYATICSTFTVRDNSGVVLGQFEFLQHYGPTEIVAAQKGRVFLANQVFDSTTPSKIVAVKFEKGTNESLQRLENEHKAGILINEKGIAGVPKIIMKGKCNDFPEEFRQLAKHDDVTVLITEAIQGQDLLEILIARSTNPGEKRLSSDEIVLLTVKILNVMLDMHEVGVTHGDLRRENVMVPYIDQTIKVVTITKETPVYLIDLENANFTGSDPQLTGGDILYMSPYIQENIVKSGGSYKRPENADDYKSFVYLIIYLVYNLDWESKVLSYDNAKTWPLFHTIFADKNNFTILKLREKAATLFPPGILDLLERVDIKANNRDTITKAEREDFLTSLRIHHSHLF